MKLTFLAHFVICLACAAFAFFAWTRGIPQMVWENGAAGWFGAIVAILVLAAAVWLGRQAWREEHDASFGRLVELLCPAVGMLGTVVGLSEAFAHVGDQMAMIRQGHTAFYSTGSGIVGMIVVMVMVYSLERGAKMSA